MPVPVTAMRVAALSAFWAASALNVSYDERSFLVNGERSFILSGSVHPARVHPDDWPRVISLATELGLNTIQVYLMWDDVQANATAPFVFEGKDNYAAFIALAGDAGLHVVARLGPYVCGERTNGGVPLWMRSEAACFRCSDPGWESHMAAALTAMFRHVEPLLASSGGPIIALQVENEYSGPDVAYLTWAVATARNLTTAVPWLLCHDLVDCSAVNAAGYGVLCTINGFWYEQTAPFITQPSPVWAATQHANNPSQPLFWTEDQGWFDQWGVAQFGRHTSDLLYGFARFTAYGLSAHNWCVQMGEQIDGNARYMLTGGSNWGLTAADAVTTAYAPDTAIDWLLLRHEPRFSAFKAWLATVAAISPELLGNPIVTSPTPLAPGCEASAYGPALAFLANTAALPPPNATATATSAGSWCSVSFRGASFNIPPHAVYVVRGTGSAGDPAVVVFNTSGWADDPAPPADAAPAAVPIETSRTEPVAWEAYVEEFAFGAESITVPPGSPPMEQLGLTNNAVDTMWYDQNVSVALPGGNLTGASLAVETCGGEYVYAFIDSVSLSLSLPPPAAESPRDSDFRAPSLRQTHVFVVDGTARPAPRVDAPGEEGASSTLLRISIFVAAMGLKAVPISPAACKGVWSVVFRPPAAQMGASTTNTTSTTNTDTTSATNTDTTSATNTNTTLLGWGQRWVTAGDAARAFDPATPPDALPWQPVTPQWPPAYASSVWFRAYLPTPPNVSAATAAEGAAPAPQLAVALSLSGMSKGVVFVNGWHLGRYNLEAGSCGSAGPGGCAGSRGGCVFFYRAGSCGQPTQSLYHVPLPLLNSTAGGSNLVVIFEETDAPPGAAPPPPPPPPEGLGPGALPVGAFSRNVSAVSFVVLTQHPALD